MTVTSASSASKRAASERSVRSKVARVRAWAAMPRTVRSSSCSASMRRSCAASTPAISSCTTPMRRSCVARASAWLHVAAATAPSTPSMPRRACARWRSTPRSPSSARCSRMIFRSRARAARTRLGLKIIDQTLDRGPQGLPRGCVAVAMRSFIAIAALALLGAATLAAPAAAAPAFGGTPPGVFRTGAYDRGEWVYANGLHQALGANTDGKHRSDYFSQIAVPGDPTGDTNDLAQVLTYNFFGVGRAARNGDYQLPRDDTRWPDGTADLAELRMAIDGPDLVVRFVWNAMPRPDAQIATLTFATATAGAGAAPREWPHGAALTSPWQAALTQWGTGATLAAADGSQRKLGVRSGDHVTDVRVPLDALPAGPWALTGGAGLADPAAPDTYWA